MSMEFGRQVSGISCFQFQQTLLFLIEVILPGICAYVLAVILFSHMAKCIDLYSSQVVPGAGVFSGLARVFFSDAFSLLLLHAVLTQIYSTMLVISFATLCRTGLFRARAKAKAILACLRKPILPATLFFVAVVPAAFRLLHVLGEQKRPSMLLGGGAACLAGTLGIAVEFHLACGVQVVRSLGAMRTSLALVSDSNFRAPCTAFPRFIGGFATLAVSRAFPAQALALGRATNAVVTVVAMVVHVTQPVVYLVLWDIYYSH